MTTSLYEQMNKERVYRHYEHSTRSSTIGVYVKLSLRGRLTGKVKQQQKKCIKTLALFTSFLCLRVCCLVCCSMFSPLREDCGGGLENSQFFLICLVYKAARSYNASSTLALVSSFYWESCKCKFFS